jgi:acyl-CoA synthetase (AMP-forming)/AMP-acid ligase II
VFLKGTTGTPKAVLTSHHSAVNGSYFFGRRMDFHVKVCVFRLRSILTLQRCTDCIYSVTSLLKTSCFLEIAGNNKQIRDIILGIICS